MLLYLAGKDLKEIYKTLKTNNKEFNTLVDKLTNYFKPTVNVTYERYVFKQAKQGKDESIINFVTRLRSLTETCNLLNISEAVKNQPISAYGSTKLVKIDEQMVLKEKKLTLDKCMENARNR